MTKLIATGSLIDVSYLNHLTAFYIIHFFSHQKYVVGVIRDSLYLTTFKTKTFIEFHAFMSLFWTLFFFFFYHTFT